MGRSNHLETQWPRIMGYLQSVMGYLQSIMGYFGAQQPVVLGYLAISRVITVLSTPFRGG